MDKENLMAGELSDGSNFSEESNAALRESAKNAADKGIGKVSEEDNRAVDYGLPTQPGDGAEIDDQKIDEVLDLVNKVDANRNASQKKVSQKEKSLWTAPLNEVPLGDGAYGVIAPQKKTGATATNWDEAVAAQGAAKSNKANGYTRNVIAQNRAIAEQGKTNEAKQSLALFDGLAAALDALKADTSKSEDYTKRVRNPVEFNHDDQGRILGQKDTTYTDKVMGKVAGGNGYQREEGGFRKGFVQRDVVNALNNTLKERGANYRIAGVMAKQRLNGIGEPTGEPVFYVEKIGEDGNRRGAYYTMRQVAQMGLDGYKATGGGDDDGNEFVISALGGDDPLGYGTRREAHRMAAQKGLSLDDRLAIEREKNKGKIDVENARGQNRIDVASANNKSRESIADKNNAAKLKIADIGAELKRLGFEVDEKKLAEAIRHNKANEATANNRVAETTRHNQVAEGQGQSRLDETSRHNKANEAHQSAELDEKKRHNQETEGLRKQWNDIYDRVRTQANILKSNGNLMTDDERKRVIEEMKSMQKILWGGGLEGENRTAIRDRLNVLSRQLTGKTADKGADDGDTNGNKSITGYVYTADRKWRKPRYEDGTVGKAELTPVK